MLQALQIQPTDKVLEIGTGSGFVTACLAKLGEHVDSIEYHEALSKQARVILEKQALENVNLIISDIVSSPVPNKKYDVIAITASMPAYDNQFEKYLAENGRLFVISGNAPVMHAKLVTRIDDTGFSNTNLFETNLSALIGMHAPEMFEL